MSRTCKTCGDISCPYKSYHWSTGCVCYITNEALKQRYEMKDFYYRQRVEQIDLIHNIELKADLLELKFLRACMQRKKR